MRDFDIKIEKNSIVTIFGTEDDTIVIPAEAKIDPSRSKFDISLGDKATKFGIPHDSEKIEINADGSNITVENVSFERLEIDGEGSIRIFADRIDGNIDINMLKGEAVLIVPEGFVFNTRCEGKNNEIICEIETDPNAKNTIELNGKNSVLTIRV